MTVSEVLIVMFAIFTVIVVGCFSIKYAINRRRKSKIPEIKQRLDNLINEYSKYVKMYVQWVENCFSWEIGIGITYADFLYYGLILVPLKTENHIQ